MKKKVLCMLLTGAMTAGVFAGCGTSGEDAASTSNVANEQQDVAADAAEEEAADAAEEAAEENADAQEDAAGSDFDTSKAVNVYSRENGSGTRGAFIELFGIEEKDADGNKVDYTTEEAVITNNTEVMLTSIAGDPFGIGYVSLGSLNDSVKALKIDGAEATVDNIKAGTYTIARPFNIATKGEVDGVAEDFIDFIMSADGQAVIEDKGYISVNSGESFTSSGAEGKIVVGGSSSVSPVMEKLIEAYLGINTAADIELQTSDSTTGMTGATDGTLTIGMASRELKDSEVEAGLVGTTIAMDGIAVVVNLDNPTDEMTSEQVKGVFKGELVTWEDAVK